MKASTIGTIKPLSFGLLGRVLMSDLEDEEIKRILKKYPLEKHTPYSIIDINTFRNEVEKIRHQGYGIELEEVVEGVIGIAAPIRDYSRRIIGAISVCSAASKKNDNKFLKKVIDLLKSSCHEISTNLGYLKI